jgi:hypothetical protein
MNERGRYRGGFVGPILLIGAGIVFLLNNLGIISWDVWSVLLRLWPVILIAVGLDLLVGRRVPLGSLLLGLLLIVVLVLAVQGALPEPQVASLMSVDRTQEINGDLKGAERASVVIRFGAGTLNLGALPEDSPQLIRGTVDLSRNETLNQSYSGSNGAVSFTLESEGSWTTGADVFMDSGKSWDLSLNRDIPLDLRVSSGAGKSSIDLTSLNLSRFDLNGGVGQVTVKLPAQGRYPVRVDGGVGQIVIMVPEGLAARVRVDGGLGGVTTEGDFSHSEDTYTTGNFDTAENRAEIQVDGGIGQIVLRTLSE